MIIVFRKLIKVYWRIIPHWLIPQSQFASGICRRCGLGWEAHL